MNTTIYKMNHLIKNETYFLFFVLLLCSCNKESEKGYGTMQHKILFTVNQYQNTTKSAKSTSVNTYTQFGTYITSLTPSVFTAKIRIMNYVDNWDLESNSTHIISYIDGHDNLVEITPIDVDFSNNQEVSITPILYSKDLQGDRIFGQRQVTFLYFNFVPDNFYQEVVVPNEYANVNLSQFQCIPSKSGFTLQFDESSVLPLMFTCGYPTRYVFGNTNSTFIFNEGCQPITMSENNPFGGTSSSPVVRSKNFTPLTVTMPEAAQTITLYSTVCFDTQNLIQVYAGADNIPYTSDDVFVYAPKYWERLSVNMAMN